MLKPFLTFLMIKSFMIWEMQKAVLGTCRFVIMRSGAVNATPVAVTIFYLKI